MASQLRSACARGRLLPRLPGSLWFVKKEVTDLDSGSRRPLSTGPCVRPAAHRLDLGQLSMVRTVDRCAPFHRLGRLMEFMPRTLLRDRPLHRKLFLSALMQDHSVLFAFALVLRGRRVPGGAFARSPGPLGRGRPVELGASRRAGLASRRRWWPVPFRRLTKLTPF